MRPTIGADIRTGLTIAYSRCSRVKARCIVRMISPCSPETGYTWVVGVRVVECRSCA